MKTYLGACHCGDVKYEVQADLSMVVECNCSMCSKKGTLLAFAPLNQFKLLSGESSLSNYQFNKKVIHHTFCKNCGVTPFLSAKDSNGNHVKAINVRCLDGVDLKSLNLTQVDGRSI